MWLPLLLGGLTVLLMGLGPGRSLREAGEQGLT